MAISLKSKDRLQYPGDFNLDDLILVSYNGFNVDIKPLLIEFVIHEDIYSSCVSGEIILTDAVNLIRHLPIIGNEYLILTFNTPGRPIITKKFFVYKIDDRVNPSDADKQNIYTIYFTSAENIVSRQKKISRSYSNLKISDMVSSIFNDYLLNTSDTTLSKTLYVHPTLGNKNIVIPYMEPLQAIDFLAKRAISDSGKDYSYMFYETLDRYNFCTINECVNSTKDALHTYTYFKSNLSISPKYMDEEFSRIENFQLMDPNNSIRNIQNGVFSSKILTHDITTKSFKETDFSYNTDYYGLNLINPSGMLPVANEPFSNNPYSNYSFYPQHSYLHDGIINNDDYEKIVIKRQAHMNHFDTSKMMIGIAVDTARHVGDIVQINIFSAESKPENGKLYDPYISGKYLVTRVTHYLQKGVGKTRLFLERDSQAEGFPITKEVKDA